jgi:hypothetical protein
MVSSLFLQKGLIDYGVHKVDGALFLEHISHKNWQKHIIQDKVMASRNRGATFTKRN